MAWHPPHKGRRPQRVRSGQLQLGESIDLSTSAAKKTALCHNPKAETALAPACAGESRDSSFDRDVDSWIQFDMT
jgi:hypothetical protein